MFFAINWKHIYPVVPPRRNSPLGFDIYPRSVRRQISVGSTTLLVETLAFSYKD